MKKTISLFLVLASILSCKDNSFKNWEKTEDGYYQKTTFPYKKDWKRIDRTLNDTLNGTFEVYNKNGTINHRGEIKDGKIYGNLYQYNSNGKLKEYSFIWEDCDDCKDLPAAHYLVEYDSVGKQKEIIGKAIIDFDIKQSQIQLKDSIELNILLATPPFFLTELVIIDNDTKAELKFISNPKNENKIKIGFNSIGNKRIEIQYALIQEESPTGMLSTSNIENIIVTE